MEFYGRFITGIIEILSYEKKIIEIPTVKATPWNAMNQIHTHTVNIHRQVDDAGNRKSRGFHCKNLCYAFFLLYLLPMAIGKKRAPHKSHSHIARVCTECSGLVLNHGKAAVECCKE